MASFHGEQGGSYPPSLDKGLNAGREATESRQRDGDRGGYGSQNKRGRDDFGRDRNFGGGSGGSGYRGDRNWGDRRGGRGGNGQGYSGRQHQGQGYGGGGYGGGGGRGSNFHRQYDGGHKKPRLPRNIELKSTIEVLPEEVQQTKELLTALSNMTDAGFNNDDLSGSIRDLAEVMCMRGELAEFGDEISDLFVTCFCKLSVQVPIIATILAMISKSDRDFPALVLDKLCFIFPLSLKQGDVLTAKLGLRSLACLTSCNVIGVSGDGGGMMGILTGLIDSVENAIEQYQTSTKASTKAEAAQAKKKTGGIVTGQLSLLQSGTPEQCKGATAAYLLATTLPYCSNSMASNDEGKAFLLRCTAALTTIKAEYTSPFDVTGTHAIFYANVNEIEGLAEGPEGAAVWDNLWSSCASAIDSISTALRGDATNLELTGSGALLMPWLGLKDELDAEPEVMKAAEKVEKVEGEGEGEGRDTIKNEAPPKEETTEAEADAEPEMVRQDVPFHIELDPELGSQISEALPSKMATAETAAAGAPTLPSWLHARFPIFDTESWPINCPIPLGWTALTASQRHYAVDYFRDILHFFDVFIKDDGTRIGSLTTQLKHFVAVEKLFPGDTGIVGLLAEVLLNKCVEAGVAGGDSLQIHRVLMEFCKTHQEFVPSILAAGASVLYRLIPATDVSAWREITSWLSFHLANFGIGWPYWSYWANDFDPANEDSDEHTRQFIGLLVDKISRVQSVDTIKKVLPAEVHSAIPNLSKVTPNCPFYSATPSADLASQGVSIAKEILTMVEQREDIDEMETFFEKYSSEDDIDGSGMSSSWKARFLIHAIFIMGQNFRSDMENLLDKYTKFIKSLCVSESDSSDILRCIISAYEHEPGTLASIFPVFLTRGLITTTVLISWASEIAFPIQASDSGSNSVVDMWAWQNMLTGIDSCLTSCKTSAKVLRELLTAENAPDDSVIEAAQANVEAAITEAPVVFDLVISRILTAIMARYTALGYDPKKKRTDDDDDDEGPPLNLDPFILAATSLLKFILRSYRTMETDVDSEEPLGDLAGAVDAAGGRSLPEDLRAALVPFLSIP